jgi:hypothetical protein
MHPFNCFAEYGPAFTGIRPPAAHHLSQLFRDTRPAGGLK